MPGVVRLVAKAFEDALTYSVAYGQFHADRAAFHALRRASRRLRRRPRRVPSPGERRRLEGLTASGAQVGSEQQFVIPRRAGIEHYQRTQFPIWLFVQEDMPLQIAPA